MPSPFCRAILAFAVGFVVAAGNAASPEKHIRLRYERITTTHPAAAKSRPDTAPASGLFLIQFEATPTSEQRAQLAALGVDLLTYVPDDTFIAQFEQVPPGQLRALPFVHWVGPFKTEYKLHEKLAAVESAILADVEPGIVPGGTNVSRSATQDNAATSTPPEAHPGGRMPPSASGRRPATDLEVAVLLAPRAKANANAAARAHFSRVHGETALAQGTILRGAIPPGRLQQLAESSAVLWIEPAPRMKLFDEISTKIVAGDDGQTATLASVHQLGYTGTGVTVAVADSGLDSGEIDFMHPDIAGRVAALFHYGNPPDAADEHSHGTHCAGIIAGNGATGETDENGYLYGLGVAPGASLIGQRIFDGAGNYTYPHASFEKLTRDAKSAGADIGSNSWGDDTQGRYDLSAMEFDALVRDAVSDDFATNDQPYILEFSAGNAGPGEQTIGSPAVAKNVIATGASQNDRFDFLIYADGSEAMADFSSRGPCEDGRIKPDVVAPGTWIASLRSVYANDDNAWGPISANYLYQGGTSQAGPQVSGAAAVFVQFYRSNFAGATPSPALVKAALIHSAAGLDEDFGNEPAPNSVQGWGRVDLTELIGTPRDFDFVDQTATLTNGGVFERRLVFANPAEPLKITLTYTDVPGLPAVIPALVNDLDLEVIAPNGAVYRGNQFLAGESVANAPAHDGINNVEGVFIAAPTPGEYVIRVHARRVVQDARRDTPATDQDFALVTSGELLPGGQGLVYFNQGTYTAPGSILVSVIDTDLAGQPSAAATIASTLQPTPLNLTLIAAGNTGVFTGSVATATAPVVLDGQLHIAHGDTITATYQDTSASVTRTATALADLQPPVITAVTATNEFGSTFIRWNTDEPADSIVRHATNTPLTLAATNASLVTAHEVQLTGLQPGATYWFAVSSADEAGNRATNNNSGANFSFVAAVPLPVLLVDAYAPFDSDDSPVIPVTAYTDALDATGIDYDVWNVESQGLPSLLTLQGYRVVVWRLNDSLWGGLIGYPGLSAAERSLLTSYVTNGGALCLTSMEVLSRMGTGGDALAFRSNILHVAAFNEDNDLVGVDAAIGYDADPIGNGMGLLLDYSNYDSDFWQILGQSPNVSDTLTPTTNAAPVFFDAASSRVCGVRYPRTGEDSVGRVVFLSFPLDAVSLTDDPPDNRANLLRNSLSFLAPGLNGIGTLALNNSAYAVPSLVTVEVADSDLVGAGTTTATFATDTQTNGITVTLTETVLPGLFRGTLTLVIATNTPGPGQLRATHGDSLRGQYFDASGNSLVLVEAEVDAQPPGISDVASAAAYQECTITWSTSEDADALVQFWEGVPGLGNNRTAYEASRQTEHAVTLTALRPDTLYSYQVVSRDTAGNTATDNNGGEYYTFRTLAPKTPPYVDNLESPGTHTNWSVINSEYSETGWTLGPPANGVETEAVSPTRAWGSSLNGDNVSAIETYLLAPAIALPTSGTPTLRFWHSYDFTERAEFDIFEFGDLSIATNSAGPLIPLLQLSDDFSFGWEEVEIDLTPYRGQVIYLVWTHFLFSLDFAPRPGWLLDDISVTVSDALTGTLVVSNNLWQASFTLDGAPHSGRTLIVTNAAAGPHVVAFNAVPFYNTPAPQTNTLAAGSTNLFTGNYSFTDANSNGISDAWELAQFSEVSTNRTYTTDTDGDGMSDYAEFIAGTNPNDPLPPFHFTYAGISNSLFRADWTTVPGWSYRVHHTTNLAGWTPLSAWILADSTNTSYTTPLSGTAREFRVEATNTTGLPAALRLTATSLGGNSLRFDWTATGPRAYRLLSSTNLATWTPASAWLQTNTFTLTPLPVAPSHFRLEVAP